MFTNTGNLSNSLNTLSRKLKIAEQVRNESKRNWMLVSQMRVDTINENRYMISKRQQLTDALKETLRMGSDLKRLRETAIQEQKVKIKRDIGIIISLLSFTN